MMADSIVAQSWPLAGNGMLVLNVFHNAPNADALALLEPVVAAIEAYQSALAELLTPTPADGRCQNCGKMIAQHGSMALCASRTSTT